MKIRWMVLDIDGHEFEARNVSLHEARQGDGEFAQEIQVRTAYSKHLFRRVDEPGIWRAKWSEHRIMACLAKTHIEYISDLVQMDAHALLRIEGFGAVCLKVVKDVLFDMNLRLGMSSDDVAREITYKEVQLRITVTKI